MAEAAPTGAIRRSPGWWLRRLRLVLLPFGASPSPTSAPATSVSAASGQMQWALWAAHHLAVLEVLGMLPDPASSLVMPLAGAAAVAFDATRRDEGIYIAVLVEATERVKARIQIDGSAAPPCAARGHRVLCLYSARAMRQRACHGSDCGSSIETRRYSAVARSCMRCMLCSVLIML